MDPEPTTVAVPPWSGEATAPTRHVVFVGHSAEPSGAEIALSRLAAELTRRPANRVRAVLLDDGPIAAVLRERGVDVTVHARRGGAAAGGSARVGGSLVGQVRGALSLLVAGVGVAGLLRSDRPDVLVAETLKALLVCAVAGPVSRTPVVWHAHDRLSGDYLGRPTATVLRALVRVAASGLVANSRTTLGTLPVRTGPGGPPSAVVYPGLEPDAERPREPQRPAAECVMVMVGRIDHWKGHRVLLDAVAAMRHPPRRLVVVGGRHSGREDLDADLRRHAAGLGDRLDIEFTGHVDDPASVMADADVLVHCSTLPEPFGQVIVEGMQQGCAVVAAGAGGPLEIVTDGVDGLLHPPGDVGALAAVLDTLVVDRDLRTRLAEAGRARARDFGISAQADEMERLLDAVAGKARHRRGFRA